MMKTTPRVLGPIVLLALMSVAAIRPWSAFGQKTNNQRPPTPKETQPDTSAKAHVLNLRFIQTNQIAVGTNVVSLADMTNQLAHVRENIDVIAFHSSLEPSSGNSELTTWVLENIARIGIPLLVVAKDGSLSLPAAGAEGGPHTLGISTDWLLKLRSGLDPAQSGRSAIPSLRSRMEWNEGKENYKLRGIELGLPGSKNIWLMYEQDDDGNDLGGIRFKNKW